MFADYAAKKCAALSRVILVSTLTRARRREWCAASMVKPSKMCKRRLHKEWKAIVKDPVDFVLAAPNPNNLLEWHFVIDNIDDARYRGGCYHGMLVFPPEYPWKPPSLTLKTLSGRFQTNTRLCLSMTDFHPESWNPVWSVSSILAAVVSFFVEDTQTYGSIRTSDSRKKQLATQSLAFNMKNKMFRELFPSLVAKYEASLVGNDTSSKGASINSSAESSASILTHRRGGAAAREVDNERADGSVARAEASHEISNTLAIAIIGVPLVALILVIGYYVSNML